MTNEKQNTKKPTVSNALVVTLAVLLALLLFFAVKSIRTSAKLEALQTEYKQSENERFAQDSIMIELEDMFDEIVYNINYIQDKRGYLYMESTEMRTDPREQIVADVRLMDIMLFESQEKIEKLEEKLKQLGLNSAAYAKRIERLNKIIQEKNGEIVDLQNVVAVQDFHIDDFKNKLAELSSKVKEQSDSLSQQLLILSEQDDQLNTGYVAVGTNKELKDKGLISKEGAVLGIGGVSSLPKDFDKDYFIKVDMRDVKQISVRAKKAELITKHPENSYEFKKEDGVVKYLSITNPEDFWKLTRYVVIKVK